MFDLKTSILKHENKIALLILFGIAIFTFYLRTLNIDTLVASGYNVVNLVGNDPWYSIRQIELVIANGFQYSYFDPYTYYPYGDTVHWGPVFPVICGAFAVICGAVSSYDISYWSSFVPPIFAALTTILVFGIVKKLTDNSTISLISAFLSGVIFGQYYYRSVYGFLDHHVTEVFFGCLFILAYICLIKKPYVDNKKAYILLCLLTGVIYTLGFYNIPTMILFCGIVLLFTAVWCCYSYICIEDLEETLKYLRTLVFVFIVPLFVLLLTGYNTSELLLNRYSFGHVILYSIVCCLIPVISIIVIEYYEKYASKNSSVRKHVKHHMELKRWHLVVAVVCLVIGAMGILYISGNNFVMYLVSAFDSFFGNTSYSNTVSEARPWTLIEAFVEYGVGLILAGLGLCIMIFEIIKSKKPELLLVALWCIVIFYSAMKHMRYDYYLAVNICVLIGMSLYFAYRGFTIKMIVNWITKVEKFGGNKPMRKTNKSVATKSKKNIAKYKKQSESGFKKEQTEYYKTFGVTATKMTLLVVFIILALVFAFSSVTTTFNNGATIGGGVNKPSYDCMVWIENNTPDVGVDYYSIYDAETFEYPDEAYSVASWWDYGHWITSIGKRIPVSNPFQHGVNGIDADGNADSKLGVAGLFVTNNESDAVEIVENLDIKYIFTDYHMASSKFWAMATWYDKNASNDYIMDAPYYDGLNLAGYVRMYSDAFYNSVVVKLHNYDGSYRPVDVTGYIKPAPELGGIYEYGELPYSEIALMCEGDEVIYTAGLNPYNSTSDVSCLEHFRLVFESDELSVDDGSAKISFAKVFEYVEGAKINMTMGGMMYIPVTTNTGRTFMYMQQSENGEFTIPYPTNDGKYDTGVLDDDYIYIQTYDGKNYMFKVDEFEVENGSEIEIGRIISF